MPVKGTIIKKFTKDKEDHFYGIDISAQEGTPVVASRAGTVIYSGSSIPGFGNMIIIDHKDGYTSLYAHNKENLVKVGENVDRGERIARVGHTGKADSNYLHFEIRFKAEPVDPLKYLSQ